MQTFSIVLVGVAAGAVLVAIERSKRAERRAAAPRTDPTLDVQQQAVVRTATRLVQIVNESLKIASESKNAETKASRLNLAKQRLDELKRLSEANPFIALTELPEVERSIAKIELGFRQVNYQEAAAGNMRGQSLEKEGKLEQAIFEYERLVELGVDTPFTYRRLAIIYARRKETEQELRVLRAATRNVPAGNSDHYRWFVERLAKRS